ncbi:Hypothetical Protein FCC1311_054242 [Hondaea fermentalgiana]|uniref:Uncharacterized protein n=1 Tax=Hondaea fermentalgiana TaxID=2315210 RepID=A0A2R5GE34_9STRA|nr:Hypothetical Protein FCC1311_054242 [Hondaea fermentalgiana]|eukprot:GBG29202.1 Hypothetical Protein FCC1311_054242 [Hondaea fermentalgiana]
MLAATILRHLLVVVLALVVVAAAAGQEASDAADAAWEMDGGAAGLARGEVNADAGREETHGADAANASALSALDEDESCEDNDDTGLEVTDAANVDSQDGEGILMNEGEEEMEEPEDVPFEDITGNLTIVKPLNGSETEGRAVAVQLNVNTNCINVTRFQEKYNTSNICISLDDSDFACWPIFGLSRFPLYTNLTEGAHHLVAKLVDPLTGEELIDESVAESTFFMVPVNETAIAEAEAAAAEERARAEEDEDAEDQEEPAEPETETIQIPQVGIEYPATEYAVPGTFEVRLHIVTATNLTQFRRLFQNSFICLALDEASHQVCWPIFEETYYPKFFNLKPGAHTLVAHLSHPNTLEIIPGTAMEIRTFWVTEKNQGMIPMTLRAPSEGSNAFGESTQATTTQEADVQPSQETSSSSSSVTMDSEDEAQSDKPHVSLQINVDGQRHVLLAFEGEDPVTTAGQFCVEKKIFGQNCVSSISRLIEVEWQKLRDIPHIELFST